MADLAKELNDLEQQALGLLETSKTQQDLECLRAKFLGRKSRLSQILSSLSSLPLEHRGPTGKYCNDLKNKLSALIGQKSASISNAQKKNLETLDVTMPGIISAIGTRHPLAQVSDEIYDIFVRLGFEVVSGPEIETEYHNFEALNIAKGHPSRQTFDTFYLDIKPHANYGMHLMRSQTSTVQIRVMEKKKPPLRIVSGGRVYRPDATDASHSFMFHQIEGFMVDKDVKFAHLKGVITEFLKQLFGDDIKMRLRPHFFPFTEPSVEVDISCIICKGGQHPEPKTQNPEPKRCSVCGGKGWLEVMGAGLIHPNVFRAVKIDEKKYSGFAFGMGVERIAMLKLSVNDIRLFFENDLRFLKQF